MSLLTSPRAAFENALAAGISRKTALIRNKLAGRILSEGAAGFPRIWTGTVVAFPAPGEPFKDSTIYPDIFSRTRYVLDTKAIKGERGAALVLEAGTYDLQNQGGDRIFLPKAAPIILPGFPQDSGWFSEDEATGLPVLGARAQLFLWRMGSEAILPVARDWGKSGWAKKDVFLNQRPSAKLHALYAADIEEIKPSAPCKTN